MTLFDVVIAGTGPAGTFAAHELQDKNVLVLDIGHRAAAEPKFKDNYFKLHRSGDQTHDELLGPHFESLHNVDKEYLMPKLKAPLMRFITKDSEKFCSIVSESFSSQVSSAQGGLANAWGAQMYPFTENDLRDFPVSYSALAPYYDFLTRHMGINGENDDLAPHIGSSTDLQPPMPLGIFSRVLLKRYNRRRAFFKRRGVALGRARLAILTRNHEGRPAHDRKNLEFFQTGLKSIYSPRYTFDVLCERNRIRYERGMRVLSYSEQGNQVEVLAESVKDGSIHKFVTKKFVLACGTVNSAKIVLASNRDFESKLPLLDNVISYIPFLNPLLLGSPLDPEAYAIQLNLTYQDARYRDPLFGTFYGISGILRSDLLLDFPLSIGQNIEALRYVLPALNVLQLWYPSAASEANWLRLNQDGSVHVDYTELPELGKTERSLISSFLRCGLFSSKFLCKYPRVGNSFHYAGTLPMKEDPGPYQTDPDGRLFGNRHVHVVDGATFPYLPSKNLSFTIMANAMRIASRISQELSKGSSV